MHYGKRFPFVDLLIVTMITYGRLSLSGVVGDHPGETTIRKGRSMNIQLMNVAVDIIEQRLAPLAQRQPLTLLYAAKNTEQNHARVLAAWLAALPVTI